MAYRDTKISNTSEGMTMILAISSYCVNSVIKAMTPIEIIIVNALSLIGLEICIMKVYKMISLKKLFVEE